MYYYFMILLVSVNLIAINHNNAIAAERQNESCRAIAIFSSEDLQL